MAVGSYKARMISPCDRSGGEPVRSSGDEAHTARRVVVAGIPERLRPSTAELVIWRAFLGPEIDAILRDEELDDETRCHLCQGLHHPPG